MRKTIVILFMVAFWAGTAAAQDRAWLQVEAHPTLREAQDRARAYGTAFADVNGFRLSSGWYAIALGPYTPAAAASRLATVKRDRLVPGDAYVSDGGNYRQQFWPVGANTLNAQPAAPARPDPASQATLTPLPDETPAEARRSEAALDRQARMLLQEALQWEGFYDAAIDGAFGRGTRAAMADYQTAMGLEPTGVLTTAQRDALVDGYRAQFAALGLQMVDDRAAGIRITMPTKMVEFTRYEPPFVHYDNTAGNGVRVLLISQKGDQNTLFGLYDIMQTLEIVPVRGARERDRDSFVLTGQNATLHSYSYAALADGMVKGFTLIWKPEDARLMNRVAQMMRDSFAPYGDTALDETLGTPTDQSIDLLSGLEIRRPSITRTGFYIDDTGSVLTTGDGLEQCARVTVGNDHEARIAAQDGALGLAMLRPLQSLAPIGFAAFQTGLPRLQSDIAVAGFSYGGVLDLPVLTYGTLADIRGLDGEADLNRLAIDALPGDAGGPVFDGSGAVLGVLLPRPEGGRRLPADVRFAASVPAIADFLSASGISPAAAEPAGQIAPEDLTRRAADMTVLVSCWN